MLKSEALASRPVQIAALVTFAVVAALCCALALFLYNKVSNWHFARRARKHAAKLRKDAKTPVFVRQTDVVTKMAAIDRRTYRDAEALIAAGKIREGAKLFESIRFQRMAIDELEKAGFIDDACAVLLRMNVPHRAAVIYERNGLLEKAAALFAQSDQHENAGRLFVRLGDPFFEQAVTAYERAKKPAEVMRVLASGLRTQRLVEVCRRENQFDGLVAYAREARLHVAVAAALTPADGPLLPEQLPLTAQNAVTLASWASCGAFAAFMPQIMARLAASAPASAAFWGHLSREERVQVLERCAHEPRAAASVLTFQAQVLGSLAMKEEATWLRGLAEGATVRAA